MRYGGARHLRSAGRDLNFFQYFSLDVMMFLGAVLFSVVAFNYIVLRAIRRKIVGNKGHRVGSNAKEGLKKKQN